MIKVAATALAIAIWSVGPTSFWVWPGSDRIDYQVGTS